MLIEEALGARLDRPQVRRLMLGAFAIVAAILVIGGGPLGWDEAVYAARAKNLAASGFDWSFRSGSYWSDVRAPGLPIVQSVLFWLVGSSDVVARSVVVAAALGFLVMLGRTLDLIAPARVGTTAIVLIGLCPGFMATSTIGLADIPAGFTGTTAVWVMVRSYVSGSSRTLIAVPLLVAVATAIRFGAIFLVIAPIAVITVLAAVRGFARRDVRLAGTFAAATLGSIVVLGLLLGTTILTEDRSPLRATRALVENNNLPANNWMRDLRRVLHPGVLDYGFAGTFWGWSFALPFGLLATVAVVRLMAKRRFVVFVGCGVISVAPLLLYAASVNQFVTSYLAPIFAIGATMVAIGLWSPSLERLAPTALTAGRTAQCEPAPIGELTRSGVSPSTWRARLSLLRSSEWWAGVALLTVCGGVGITTVRSVREMHDRASGFDHLRHAAEIADDVLGRDCRVVTSRTPQVAWYSDCWVVGFTTPYVDVDANGAPDDLDSYLSAQAARAGVGPGEPLGLVLVEGFAGQPPIEAVRSLALPDRFIVLQGPDNFPAALIAVEAPDAG